MNPRTYRPRAIVRLTVPLPEPGGEWEPITYDVEPLNGVYADVTLSLDVSPQAYYAEDPFGD